MPDDYMPAGVSERRASLAVAGLEVATLPHRQRFALRCAPGDLASVQPAWPTEIPTRVGAAAASAGHAALCLGPDEWLLIAPAGAELFTGPPESCAYSLTDVSDRSIGIRISGPKATMLLASAVPLDLRDLTPSTATRTVFGRIEALVWRPGEALEFEIEVWRSFADYLWTFADTVAAELR